jgi:hypothetical protein
VNEGAVHRTMGYARSLQVYVIYTQFNRLPNSDSPMSLCKSASKLTDTALSNCLMPAPRNPVLETVQFAGSYSTILRDSKASSSLSPI